MLMDLICQYSYLFNGLILQKLRKNRRHKFPQKLSFFIISKTIYHLSSCAKFRNCSSSVTISGPFYWIVYGTHSLYIVPSTPHNKLIKRSTQFGGPTCVPAQCLSPCLWPITPENNFRWDRQPASVFWPHL